MVLVKRTINCNM